jgi:hypothetical protein
MSRIFGGIHFLSGNRDGKICGAKIGRQVFENFLLPHNRLPALLSVERAGPGMIELCLHGRIGTTCVLEASSDLLAWQPVSTNVAAVGGVVLVRPAEDVSARFYRLRER